MASKLNSTSNDGNLGLPSTPDKYKVPLPSCLHELPHELQKEVFRHTFAKFDVKAWTFDRYNIEHQGECYRGIIPVLHRYEFKLARRRGDSGPELRARFSWAVDPFFKTTGGWRQMSPAMHGAIERAVSRSVEIPPFSELRVDLAVEVDALSAPLSDAGEKPSRFYFVRRGDLGRDQPHVEFSPTWSSLYRDNIEEVRDKLKTVFRMDLRDQHMRLLI